MASTPVIGAHWMIDVFGGVALAVVDIWPQQNIFWTSWRPRRRRHRLRRKPPQLSFPTMVNSD
jgi:membrane-associated phospholipid phosphatase